MATQALAMDRLGVIASHLTAGMSFQQPSPRDQLHGFTAPVGRLVIVVGGAVLDIQASGWGLCPVQHFTILASSAAMRDRQITTASTPQAHPGEVDIRRGTSVPGKV